LKRLEIGVENIYRKYANKEEGGGALYRATEEEWY